MPFSPRERPGRDLRKDASISRTVSALPAAGRVIAGLDIRDYDAEGRFVEVAWSAFEPGISASLPHAVESSRAAAMTALDRAFEHRSWNDPWVVVTW